jgi:hypothetical protein
MLISAELVNIFAILLSPVIAVLITLWYQRRKEKRDTKIKLFTTLMTYRKALPRNPELVNALNLIDVVFSDHPKVLKSWHNYYDLLNIQGANPEQWNYKLIDLMTEMAKVLGYNNLPQIQIDKYYEPISKMNQLQFEEAFRNELLRVLTNTASFVVKKKTSK